MTKIKTINNIDELNQILLSCRLCPRLVAWREDVAQKKTTRYKEWEYWGKPVPGFGDPNAELLIVGLAPAAHGANRTGRMFTGDRSGDWLYTALYKFRFANQPVSRERNDGLELKNCYITAAVRCAPPQNKPTAEELTTCRQYLLNELQLLKNIRVIIALGKIAFDTVCNCSKMLMWSDFKHKPQFHHGAEVLIRKNLYLLGSYHPSQQNTFTGRLTKKMFHSVFRQTRKHLISL